MPSATHAPAPDRPTALQAVGVYALGAGAITLWAATAVVTKVAVTAVDPLLVGVLRTVLGVPVVLAAAAVWRLHPPRTGRELRLLLVSGLGGFALFPVLFALGVRYSTAGHAGLVLAAQPVLTGLIAAAVARAWPRPLWWLGVAIALGGEAALIGLRFGFGHGGTALGDLLILGAALSASAGYVAGGRLGLLIGTWATTCWGIVLGGVVLLPALAWVAAAGTLAALDAGTWAAVAYLALGSNLLAYGMWYFALGRGGVARVSLVQFAQPVVTLLLAALLLSEALTVPLLVAAAVILAGIAIARRR